jgi:hypothetical protein
VVGNTLLPKLAVYSSPDLTSGSWEFRGLLHNNTDPGWAASPQWPWAPNGAWYSPWAVWSEARQKVVLYFTCVAVGVQLLELVALGSCVLRVGWEVVGMPVCAQPPKSGCWLWFWRW